MSTMTWSLVQPWIASNPHSLKLSPFKNASTSVEGPPEIEGLAPGWTKRAVQPATPLSAVLMAQDVLYSGMNEGNRRGILRDEVTDLQEKSVLLLKGRQWPLRRTAEGLVAVGLEEGRTWPELGWSALCALRECQIVTLNEDKKQVGFFPTDVRTWSREIPVLVLDHEVRYLHTPPKGFQLGLWLSRLEADSWSVAWPLADGTMVELKSKAETLHETVHGKVTKDQLCKRIGRAEAVRVLADWVCG